MVSVQRILGLETIPQEISKGIKPPKAWPQHGKVEFKDVTLKYRPTTEDVLHKLSFTVEPGHKVGVVGRTGAGKSTLCLALSRIVELTDGKIEIDGQDISEVRLSIVRQNMTVIPQDPTLFTGTLKFNLDPMELCDDERIESLLIKAGCQDLLQREPEDEKDEGRGLYYKIKDAGGNLSSGEKQLICICRAILQKNKVVLLDEATANIDIKTEKKIQQLISEEFKDSTMIVIAHRLNTIISSDRVLVLSHGTDLEYDSPQKLMDDPYSEFTQLLKELKKKKKQDK